MNRRKLVCFALTALLLVNLVVSVPAQSARRIPEDTQRPAATTSQRRGKTPSDDRPSAPSENNTQQRTTSSDSDSRAPQSRDNQQYPQSRDSQQYPQSRDSQQYPQSRDSQQYPRSQTPASQTQSQSSGSQSNGSQSSGSQSGSQNNGSQQPGTVDDSSTIKIDTTLVSIPVSVMDRDGKYVPNLNKRDFQLYEDGVEQEITDFGPVEVPFHVVLMLDTSRSTAFRHEDIQQAAISFVEQLRPDDRVMIISFDDKVYIDSEFTSDRARLRRAIYGTRIGGGTRLYDAVDLVIAERLDQIEGRKAIVLFTDGVDATSKTARAAGTLDQVEESGVLVYPIHYSTGDTMGGIRRGGGNRGGQGPIIIQPPWPFPPIGGGNRRGRRWPLVSQMVSPQWSQQWPQRGGRGDDDSRGEQYLRDLADRSGARMYQADNLNNLDNAFASIADELRHQYALSYYPTNSARDGSYRKIRVKVVRPALVVRARDGYRAADEHAANRDVDTNRRERPSIGRDRP